MTLTLFASFGVLTPLRGFLRRIGARARLARYARPAPGLASALAPTALKECSMLPAAETASCTRVRPTAHARTRSNRPLRVIRVLETGQTSAYGGKMIISGRMADVCAELERMAEREAALLLTA